MISRIVDPRRTDFSPRHKTPRHADIRTTMNVYGKAMDESKRAAHGKVVSLVLPSKVA
jgi:hypothetical protein